MFWLGFGCALLGAAVIGAVSRTATAGAPTDTLYIQDNNSATGQNAVLAFHRNSDGSLTPLAGSPFLTGGTGFAVPLTSPPGPFDGQNVMIGSQQSGIIYVPNGGSDSISALQAAADGSLYPIHGSPFAVPSNTPEALGLFGRSLLIASNATDPNQIGTGVGPSYLTARIGSIGGLRAIPSSNIALATDAVPSEVLPYRHTSLVFMNEFGSHTIPEYFVDSSGRFHLIQSQPAPIPEGATTPTAPIGQDINPSAPHLYVGLPGAAAVAIYGIPLTG